MKVCNSGFKSGLAGGQNADLCFMLFDFIRDFGAVALNFNVGILCLFEVGVKCLVLSYEVCNHDQKVLNCRHS